MTSGTPAPAQEAHAEALGVAMCFANRKPHMYQEHHNSHAYGPCVAHAEAARWLLASRWLAAFVAERQAEAWDESREAAFFDYDDRGISYRANPYRIGGAS